MCNISSDNNNIRMKSENKGNSHRSQCTKICGLSAIIIGTLIAVFWINFCEYIFFKEMQLTPESSSYSKWKKPPIPATMDIYFFNWTNAEQFYDTSIKPKFEQIGPYRFREYPEKINITWNPNSTVSYKMMSTFYFDEEGSTGKMDDLITTINVVAVSSAARARFWTLIKKRGVSLGLALYKHKLHVTKRASELMFEGYEDSLISTVKKIFDAKEVPFDKFGWFYMRNRSGEILGHYNVHTGVDDHTQMGVLKHWNYLPRTEVFTDKCGELHGSMGEFHPTNASPKKPLRVFTPDMCRTLEIDFEEEVDIHGVKGFKYVGGEKLVDNGTRYPENSCFFTGQPLKSGVLNISSCRYGTPVFMSYPHFLFADPYYVNQIEGMKPVEEKHKLYVVIEPTTGFPIELRARFQVNILVRPDQHLAIFNNIRETYIPVLWFEQYVKIDETNANTLKLMLAVPWIGRIFGILLATIGFLVVVVWPCLIGRRQLKHESSNEEIINQTTVQSGKEIRPLLDNNAPQVQIIEK